MPEVNNGGEVPSEQRGADTGTSRRNRSRRSNQTPRESRFPGKCDDLKGSVYDVTIGTDSFLKTTRNLSEYVASEYTDAGEYRLAMINLVLDALVEPQLPADPDNRFQV